MTERKLPIKPKKVSAESEIEHTLEEWNTTFIVPLLNQFEALSQDFSGLYESLSTLHPDCVKKTLLKSDPSHTNSTVEVFCRTTREMTGPKPGRKRKSLNIDLKESDLPIKKYQKKTCTIKIKNQGPVATIDLDNTIIQIFKKKKVKRGKKPTRRY
jgi:hypothetical protein